MAELEHRMPLHELLEWAVVFKLESEAHERAVREAEVKGKARSKGRR